MANYCENILFAHHQQLPIVESVANAFRDNRLFSTIAPEPEGEPELSDWRYKNWGCDSESFSPTERRGLHRSRDSIILTFATNPTAPLPIYEKMFAAGWRLTAYYNVLGSDFCGRFSDGEHIHFEYDKLNSVGVRKNLLPDIDGVLRLSLRLFDKEWQSLGSNDDDKRWALIQDFFFED